MIAPADMNNYRIGELIKQRATAIHQDQAGFWKFEYADSLIFVLTDQSHNRMRIMTPVAESATISEQGLQVLLKANFDRALDARYCIDDETLWSAFIHPLRELSVGQFHDGLEQVVTLAHNYGTTFSSSNIVFGG